MITTKQELKSFKEQDIVANGFSRTFLSYLTNDIWKFLRILRFYEYISN